MLSLEVSGPDSIPGTAHFLLEVVDNNDSEQHTAFCNLLFSSWPHNVHSDQQQKPG